MAVVGIRRNIGSARVYTLTVAADHDFFVGSAQALVHNASLTPGQILGCNLRARGEIPPTDKGLEWQAHHIVPRKDYLQFPESVKYQRRARQILEKFGITGNADENGVFLPGPQWKDPFPQAFHQPVHTQEYLYNLWRLLSRAYTRDEAVAVLQNIGDRLAGGDSSLWTTRLP